jgi:hypothetical protein
METALQEAIKKLQEENRAVFGEYMKDEGTNENELASESNGLLTAIRICKALLPKEREQIEQEVLNAIKWVEDNFYSNGNDFFTHIDTQVQYKRAELYKHYETNSNTK